MSEKAIKIAEVLVQWHSDSLDQLKRITDADENVNFKVENSKGEKVDLPEEYRKGFIYGVRIAMEVFSDFPIKLIKDEES